MRRLLAAAATLSLLAAGPALAAAKPVAKHPACKAPSGAFLVKPGKPLTQTPTTPVGAIGGFEEEVGDFYLDLSGKPVSTTGNLDFELSWLNPVSDYDLVVNGVNELGTDNPEFISTRAKHCKRVSVGIDLFLGAPVDELTLVTKGR
jgi:hypothetical protein